ncbi:hypothetical protein Bpfe_003482 [Biomphalaria pfeifferi]|uniref:Immunoglobulin subtype domain-containing protein n=1 Tax=Biomphalaria pfeifferi TaxID=112525 RepID=A0AAD8C5A9_BIOPF|nr:hypothetical protein Bpfe_003482 [Biomphalaria pfeifferi]
MVGWFHLPVLVCICIIIEKCTCSVAKEGQSYTLNAQFKHTIPRDLEVVWMFNSYTVSQCSVRKGCLENEKEKTKTSLKFVQETGSASCNITINNVTTEHLGTWALYYLGSASIVYTECLFKCELNAYKSEPVDVIFKSNCVGNRNSFITHINKEDKDVAKGMIPFPYIIVFGFLIIICVSINLDKILSCGSVESSYLI